MNVGVGLAPDRLYTARFFQVCAAVTVFMTGVALQFHFGQYVEFLGHGVDTLGRVLSASMIGTLAIRLRIGRWIDRFGCRPVWLVGTALVAAAVGSMQLTSSLGAIVVLRMLTTMATAAVMTTVAVFAAQIAPPTRRAESIGTIGLAGFFGMMVGPALGDWIFAIDPSSSTPYRIFFSVSAACSLLAGAVMLWPVPSGRISQGAASEGSVLSGGRGRAAQWRVIVRHWPGTVFLVGVVFAMAFCVQSLYLERVADLRGFRDIKVFFFVYAPAAMALRILFRRLPERLGRTRTLLLGLMLMSAGLLALAPVHSQSGLVIPAALMGSGHCFVFPSMVDLATYRFPAEHRGTGTSLILSAGDVGTLLGFALLGEFIESWGVNVALVALATLVLLGGGVFAIARRTALRRPLRGVRHEPTAMLPP